MHEKMLHKVLNEILLDIGLEVVILCEHYTGKMLFKLRVRLDTAEN